MFIGVLCYFSAKFCRALQVENEKQVSDCFLWCCAHDLNLKIQAESSVVRLLLFKWRREGTISVIKSIIFRTCFASHSKLCWWAPQKSEEENRQKEMPAWSTLRVNKQSRYSWEWRSHQHNWRKSRPMRLCRKQRGPERGKHISSMEKCCLAAQGGAIVGWCRWHRAQFWCFAIFH